MQFNENLISHQDAHSQIKSDETTEAEHPNETDSEEGETNKSSALSSFMPKKILDDEIIEGINSLNLK